MKCKAENLCGLSDMLEDFLLALEEGNLIRFISSLWLVLVPAQTFSKSYIRERP